MFDDAPKRNSFLYHFTAINIFGFGLLAAAVHQGWVAQVFQSDSSRITWVIALTFMFGLVASLWKAVKLNKLSNDLLDTGSGLFEKVYHRSLDSLSLRMVSDIQLVSHIATILPLMGLVGTMIGIILALQSTQAFAQQEQANMTLAIVMLFQGVYVKFYSSLVGVVGCGWLLTNYNMLSTMSRRLLARMSDIAKKE